MTPGEITNQIRVKIKNRGESDAEYRVEVVEDARVRLTSEETLSVAAGETVTSAVLVTLPSSAFQDGKYEISLRFSDGEQFTRECDFLLLGPHSP
jgi:uncharacterized membrane protein